KGENAGCGRINGVRGKRAVRHRQCEALGTAREPVGSSQSSYPGSLDAIRDSRIASQDAFGTLSGYVRHQRFATGASPRGLRAWRERNNLSESGAALKLQISKRALQEWEPGRVAPRGFAQVAIEKANRAEARPQTVRRRKSLLYVNHV